MKLLNPSDQKFAQFSSMFIGVCFLIHISPPEETNAVPLEIPPQKWMTIQTRVYLVCSSIYAVSPLTNADLVLRSHAASIQCQPNTNSTQETITPSLRYCSRCRYIGPVVEGLECGSATSPYHSTEGMGSVVGQGRIQGIAWYEVPFTQGGRPRA
jgi:hypothetical protein